jgi:hypothetical protein
MTFNKKLKDAPVEERRHQFDMAHMYKICTEKDGLRRED